MLSTGRYAICGCSCIKQVTQFVGEVVYSKLGKVWVKLCSKLRKMWVKMSTPSYARCVGEFVYSKLRHVWVKLPTGS